ncbi:CFDP2 [Symbiodinium sp. CCMP2456]|nr:CFDP2 [Symbiodinium sp. CCMP2456]
MAPSRCTAKLPLGTQATHASHPQGSSRVHKRSYIRALRRARDQGGAWYRGRWITHDPQYQPDDPIVNKRKVSSPDYAATRTTKHYELFTWNTGGLGGGLYDEFLLFLKRSAFDVALLQETKWRFESQWEDDTHYFIHSGTSAKDHSHAGLLTVISKRIVDPGSLRFISAIDGRILRVQFKHGPRQVDVINFYQHTWRPTAHVQSLRHKAWDVLNQQVQAVPLRSRLLLGGDFNTPPTVGPPHTGRHILHKPDHGVQDADDFAAFLKGLDLVLLNTFAQHAPPHTYQWNAQKSQIDFWITRRLQAGGLARCAYPLQQYHVGRWRGGPRHLPVCAKVMYHWQPWEHRKLQQTMGQTEVDRMEILKACQDEHDPRVARFRTEVQELTAKHTLTVETLQTHIFNIARRIFPKRPPQKSVKPWQDGTMIGYADTMWGHFRARAAIVRRPEVDCYDSSALRDSLRLIQELAPKATYRHFEQLYKASSANPQTFVATAADVEVTSHEVQEVCLDMSTAFDVMPREELREALSEAGIAGSPADILLHWHHLTLYADDWHISCLFHSYPAFDKFVQCLGVVLSTLKQHGMIVNADKAAVIITMQGARRKKAVAEFTRMHKDQRHLKVRSTGQDVLLPMVSETVYLGTIISYRNFRASTLEHRLTKCKATQSRLRKILQGRRGYIKYCFDSFEPLQEPQHICFLLPGPQQLKPTHNHNHNHVAPLQDHETLQVTAPENPPNVNSLTPQPEFECPHCPKRYAPTWSTKDAVPCSLLRSCREGHPIASMPVPGPPVSGTTEDGGRPSEPLMPGRAQPSRTDHSDQIPAEPGNILRTA